MNGGPIRGDIKMPMIATAGYCPLRGRAPSEAGFSRHTVGYLLGRRDVTLTEATMTIGIRIGKPNLRYSQFAYEEAEKGLLQRACRLT